jgi:hypothetical protein
MATMNELRTMLNEQKIITSAIRRQMRLSLCTDELLDSLATAEAAEAAINARIKKILDRREAKKYGTPTSRQEEASDEKYRSPYWEDDEQRGLNDVRAN